MKKDILYIILYSIILIPYTFTIHSAIFTVTNTNNAAVVGSLRTAINQSNVTPGTNTIVFNINITNPVINLTTNLANITNPVNINGTNINAAGGRVRINGSGATVGLIIGLAATGSIIEGLSITNFSTAGIQLIGPTNCVIRNNYIGITASGATGSNGNGISVLGAGTNLIIGGNNATDRNIISGNNNNGILLGGALLTASTISQNYIGTDITGSFAVPNGLSGLTSGGELEATISSNLISGNTASGINSVNSNSVLTIQNNFIGTDATGFQPIPNNIGISINNITGSSGNSTITGNVISGNASTGISCNNTDNLIIRNNFIGTSFNGTSQLGNGNIGISLTGGSGSNSIGGTLAGQGNTIANNIASGIQIDGATSINNSILRNNIFNNNAQGILLTNTGNNNQQPPILTRACLNGATLTVTGTSPAIAVGVGSLRIQFFQNNFANQTNSGQIYLGSDIASIAPNTGFNQNITGFSTSFSPTYISATATVTNASGQQNTSSFSLSIPIFSVTITPAIQILCPNGTIQFNASLVGGTGPFTFQWTGPNGFSQNTGAAPSLTILNATTVNTGNYSVSVTDSTGCQATSSIAQVVVKPIIC